MLWQSDANTLQSAMAMVINCKPINNTIFIIYFKHKFVLNSYYFNGIWLRRIFLQVQLQVHVTYLAYTNTLAKTEPQKGFP